MTTDDTLTGLGEMLAQQYNVGGSKDVAINIAQTGTNLQYGSLGGLASSFDQTTAQRSYYEQGSRRPNFFAPKPDILNVLMQDPDITVLVKKRAFTSLADNYRPDLMDAQDKLFYKATKVLFQNKCKQISNYEKLAKIAQISSAIGGVDESLLGMIFSLTDNINSLPSAFGQADLQTPINNSLSQFTSIVNRVREVVAMSQDNLTTSWITNIPNSFRSTFGEGTGVIELTTCKSVKTTTSIHLNEGSFTLSLIDPYQLMRITGNDIDQALYDSTNILYQNQFVQLGVQSLNQLISDRKQELNISRNSRGASTISFIVEPYAYLGKQVQAVIESIGYQIQFNGNATSVSIDPSALEGSIALGNEGLSSSEVGLFTAIVESLYTQMTIASSSNNTSHQSNANLKYVRNKMRLHYNGKLIIQAMDVVNIYMRSQTRQDTTLTAGLQSSFSGVTWMQSAQAQVNNLAEYFNSENSSSVEKAYFVGSDFPNWIWNAMRNQFISVDKGCHVFAGIVNEATSNYSGGFNSIEVNGTDNAGYFDYGIVNLKPSVDVYNGALYDPLTPFDIKFDSTTGVQMNSVPPLLPENKGIFQSAFVKNRSGILAGLVPTEADYLNQDFQQVQSTNVNRVFYDPDGFVYRWKEGIGTLVLFGDDYVEQDVNQPSPAITSTPYAGQDVVNVLSLLITGQPYNYATFYKAATEFGGQARDQTTGQDAANSYFRGLETSLKSRNFLYGNFVPFKKLTIDEKSYAGMLSNQLSASNFNDQLNQLLQERADAANQIASLTGNQSGTAGNSSDVSIAVSLAQQTLTNLDARIAEQITNITTALNKINAPVSIYGNDISFAYSPSLSTLGSQTAANPIARRNLRRELAFLTRRLIYKVRANEDINLVIVDDAYDKDSDIQAFEKSFSNMSLFESDYVTIKDQIKTVAAILELEVFSNSQGHIEIRNPQYNRTPSSVFYNMLRLKNETGVQVFPQFLEDLYANQVDTLLTSIGTLEDEIRLFCLAAGYVDDASCVGFISSTGGTLQVPNTGNNSTIFSFLSNEASGKVSGQDLRYIMQTSNPDAVLDSVNNALNGDATGTSLANQSNLKNTFDVGRVAWLLQTNFPSTTTSNYKGQFEQLPTIALQASSQNRYQTILTRLQATTGEPFDITQLLGSATAIPPVPPISSSNLLLILNGISQKVAARQTAIKSAANALKNLQESITLDTQNNNTTNNILAPNLNNSKTIPQMFEHMIEDESYDDLGPGSGARYVINNVNIKSMSITERRPNYTSVYVTGNYGDQFLNTQVPQELTIFQNGNALTTAGAVDYDLWRQYGISLPTQVKAPFLSDPQTQLAPYAVSLLNKERKTILSGNLTIVGNEYQQPGEVIYIEHLDQLFYVESVSQDFTFGSGFTTSIKVCYGHSPGEYIPTPYDVIGKLLYKNKDITNYVHHKQGNSFNQEHIGTIVGNTNPQTIDPSEALGDITGGEYSTSNTDTLSKIFQQAPGALSSASGNYLPVLELRVFFNSEQSPFTNANSYAIALANAVYQYLIGGNGTTTNPNPTSQTQNNPKSLAQFVQTNQQRQILVKAIDSSSKIAGEFRYPSGKAFYYARDGLGKTGSGGSTNTISAIPSIQSQQNNQTTQSATTAAQSQQQQLIDQVIYTSIVDCWIVYTNTANPQGAT
jgi:hypothetical protein